MSKEQTNQLEETTQITVKKQNLENAIANIDKKLTKAKINKNESKIEHLKKTKQIKETQLSELIDPPKDNEKEVDIDYQALSNYTTIKINQFLSDPSFENFKHLLEYISDNISNYNDVYYRQFELLSNDISYVVPKKLTKYINDNFCLINLGRKKLIQSTRCYLLLQYMEEYSEFIHNT